MRSAGGSYAWRAAALIAFTGLALLAGCRSPYVETTVANQTASKLGVIEVDYPSASFGIESLAAGAQFHYRFKIQGTGAMKIQFADAQGRMHEANGPVLEQGQKGQLTIQIGSAYAVDWKSRVTPGP